MAVSELKKFQVWYKDADQSEATTISAFTPWQAVENFMNEEADFGYAQPNELYTVCVQEAGKAVQEFTAEGEAQIEWFVEEAY